MPANPAGSGSSDEREALARIIAGGQWSADAADRYSVLPADYAAADAVLEAGFTRAHGDSVDLLRQVATENTAALQQCAAERDSLAAKLRNPIDDGTITVEDYWRERNRADAEERRADAHAAEEDRQEARAIAAEKRAAALADQLREFAIKVRGSDVPHKLANHADAIVDAMDRAMLKEHGHE